MFSFIFSCMLTLIGLGLWNKEDISVRGLNRAKNADKVYIELYTSKWHGNIKKLEEIINKKILDWEVPLYHTVPFDAEIGKADLEGKSPIDYNANSKGIISIKSLYEKLKKLKKELFDI